MPAQKRFPNFYDQSKIYLVVKKVKAEQEKIKT
jgi:hypothetical protein